MKLNIRDKIKIMLGKEIKYNKSYYNKSRYFIDMKIGIIKNGKNSIRLTKDITCRQYIFITNKVKIIEEYESLYNLENQILSYIDVSADIYYKNGVVKKSFNKTWSSLSKSKVGHYIYLSNKDEEGNLHGRFKTNDCLSKYSNGVYIHGVKDGFHSRNSKEFYMYNNGILIDYIDITGHSLEFFENGVYFEGREGVICDCYDDRYKENNIRTTFLDLSLEDIYRILSKFEIYINSSKDIYMNLKIKNKYMFLMRLMILSNILDFKYDKKDIPLDKLSIINKFIDIQDIYDDYNTCV